MYDLIEKLIGHEWVSNYTGDQQYVYYIAGACILLFSTVFIDLIYRFIRGIFKGGN